jgi:hypothetical protein
LTWKSDEEDFFNYIIGVFAVFIKIEKEYFWGQHWLVNTLIGSAPSFFYTSAIIFLIPILINPINLKRFATLSTLVAIEALMYEFEQLWTSIVFNINELVATILGFFFAHLLFLIINHYFSWKNFSST